MNITTSELVYINEAAKALKQKDFVLIDNAIIGLDNIQYIVTYVLLDSNFINNYFNGIIINQRSLSAFIKTISIESDFEFDSIDTTLRTVGGGELLIGLDQRIISFAYNKYKYAISIDNTTQIAINEVEIPEILSKIQSMSKADGAASVIYEGYYMTLFSSILPTTKSDKLYLQIFQPDLIHTFISRFRISKKKFNIITYINFIKVQ